MQRVPSVRDIDKVWPVQNGMPVKREGKKTGSLLLSGSTASTGSTTATMKRTPSAEELKLDSNDEENAAAQGEHQHRHRAGHAQVVRPKEHQPGQPQTAHTQTQRSCRLFPTAELS